MKFPIAKLNTLYRSIIPACLFILFGSIGLFAHDLGFSAMSVEITDGNLSVYSTYARAEFGELISRNDPEEFKLFLKKAFAVEVDGKILDAIESDIYLDEQDGLNLRHSFGEVSGEKIKITSDLPSKLSANHIQILKLIRNDKEISRQFLTGDDNSFVFDLEDLQTPDSFGQFLTLGITHILFGFDHLLFLLALLLVVSKFGEIVKILTFFTIAHSITLSLAVLNIIAVPPYLVEPIIAVSIIYVGLENIFNKKQTKRWLTAYIFGLIHGLGFAGVLQEIGIGSGTASVLPLLSFNLGVEIGQIAVILTVLPILWTLQKKAFFKTQFVPICSGLIAVAGFCWLVERVIYK